MVFVTMETEKEKAYYRVYLVDLDASNNLTWENCADNIKEYFKVQLLFEYETKEVEELLLVDLFVRGASNEIHNNL